MSVTTTIAVFPDLQQLQVAADKLDNSKLSFAILTAGNLSVAELTSPFVILSNAALSALVANTTELSSFAAPQSADKGTWSGLLGLLTLMLLALLITGSVLLASRRSRSSHGTPPSAALASESSLYVATIMVSTILLLLGLMARLSR